ncbi:AraC family transcriptional regulator ligand-binding domain-containing protein [Thalassolituus sp. LLYu03]|uniref:AraC family transcriptional regulator n=1 Tax=Thalassolituus sp. LLYu03 TaxID=3421656 RepID=UPI003D28E99E
MITSGWYENDERYLPAHHQPALLLDLLLARDVSSHKVLRGTGLFYEDIVSGSQTVSAAQLKQLIANGQKLAPEGDLSFRWGDNLWPGYYGGASQLLSNAPDLQRALDVLVEFRRELSPLLSLRVFSDDRYCYVQWLDNAGLGDEKVFMVETAMTALTSMARWLSGQAMPWRYGFSYARPAASEQYLVHLGPQLMFGLGVDVMVIEKSWLSVPWPRGSATAFQAALQGCQRTVVQPRDGFCEAVYDWLVQHVREPQALPDVAAAFGMSPATFKRKLMKHHTHFQQLQDQVRLHVCLYLLHIKGMNNEQVAHYLLFNDTTNFRRAFKRWTGLTPSDCRQQFQLMPG